MKKIFITGGILIVLFALALAATIWLGKQQGISTQTSPTPPALLPSIDRAEGIAGAPLKVSWSFLAQIPEVPKELPVFSVTHADPESFSLLAQSLGFSGAATETTNRDTVTKDWRLGSSSLTIRSGAPPVLSYITTTDASRLTPTVSQADAQIKVRQFLQKLSPVSPFSVTPTSITTTLVDSAGGPTYIEKSAKAPVVSAVYTLQNFLVLLQSSSRPPITVFLDGPGVYRGTVVLPPAISELPKRSLAPVSLAQQTLIDGGGVLIGLGAVGGASPEESTAPDFSAVTVTKIQLVYMALPEEQLLVPAYQFTGVAVGPKGIKFSVDYLVRATE